MSETYIVIAAYNEEKSISKVVRELLTAKYSNIIVVNDGSKDNTKNVAKEAGAIVISHIINRGQGAALRTGIRAALQKGADIIITFDADGQHCVEDIPKLEAVINNGYDAALGTRFAKGASTNAPLIRRIFLKGGALIFRLMYGIALTDSHNGLRALSKHAASTIEIKGRGMEHASEIVEEIARKKIKFKEVPVTIKYTDYSIEHGQGNLNAFRILFKMIIKKLVK